MAALGVWQKERDYRRTRETYRAVLSESLRSPEIREEAYALSNLLPERTLDLLGQRAERCWGEFERAIDPEAGNVRNPREAEPKLELCLCNELRSIKALNGTIPPGKLREWWNHYGCGPYIA